MNVFLAMCLDLYECVSGYVFMAMCMGIGS